MQNRIAALQSTTQKSAADSQKIAELQKRINALQSSTSKSTTDAQKNAVDDAKKIADLESQVAALELPTNSSVTLSCMCYFDREETETGWTERHEPNTLS